MIRSPFSPLATKREEWARRLVYALTLLFPIAIVLFSTLGAGRLSRWALAVVPAQMLALLWLFRCQLRGRRILRDSAFMICPGCKYVLRGLSPDGQCPECGSEYRESQVKAYWYDYYGLPTPREL